MAIRKFALKTQHDYVQRVKNFAAFLGRSPDTASFEDVRPAASGGERGRCADHQSDRLDVRFFFKVTLRRHEIVEHTHVIHEPRKLPVVLSPKEVARLLARCRAGAQVQGGAAARSAVPGPRSRPGRSPRAGACRRRARRKFAVCR